MSKVLNFSRDASGNSTFGMQFSDDKYNSTLLLGVEQVLVCPAHAAKFLAIFSIEPGAEVWVALNDTAVVAGAAFDKVSSELNPIAREVRADDVLHFITTNADARIGVVFYAV